MTNPEVQNSKIKNRIYEFSVFTDFLDFTFPVKVYASDEFDALRKLTGKLEANNLGTVLSIVCNGAQDAEG